MRAEAMAVHPPLQMSMYSQMPRMFVLGFGQSVHRLSLLGRAAVRCPVARSVVRAALLFAVSASVLAAPITLASFSARAFLRY
jgi:hypothetical protein